MPWIKHEPNNFCPHLNTNAVGRCDYCLEAIYEFVSDSPVVVYMKKRDIPVTRGIYLSLAYLGKPPAELGNELEAELPSEIRTEEDHDV